MYYLIVEQVLNSYWHSIDKLLERYWTVIEQLLENILDGYWKVIGKLLNYPGVTPTNLATFFSFWVDFDWVLRFSGNSEVTGDLCGLF